ncbi:MAG TPA: hypothetical protein VMV05_10870 [bacterium]|nr:hypothetical protein [bacterium]
MIENLESRNLHLKAHGLGDGSAFAVCCSSIPEHQIPKELDGRIPQALKHSQSNFPSAPKSFKQDLNLLKAEVDSDSHPFPRKSRNMGGVSFTCDASPHSPWSIVSSRKSGVGAGLLVHLTAHIAESDKTTSSTKTNIKTQPSSTLKTLLSFFICDGFCWTPFQKIIFPGTMPLLGTLGGRYE